MTRTTSRDPARLRIGSIIALLNVSLAIPEWRDAIEVAAESRWWDRDVISRIKIVSPRVPINARCWCWLYWRRLLHWLLLYWLLYWCLCRRWLWRRSSVGLSVAFGVGVGLGVCVTAGVICIGISGTNAYVAVAVESQPAKRNRANNVVTVNKCFNVWCLFYECWTKTW